MQRKKYMAKNSSLQKHRTLQTLVESIVVLSAWRLRRTWFLLLFIALGMVAAIIIVCTIPLLSGVMTTAGLRSTLRASPDGDEITVYSGGPAITTSVVQDAYRQFSPLLRRYLGTSIQETQFSLTINDFSLTPQPANISLVVYSTSMQLAATHFGQIDGRVAKATGLPTNELEVMMTPATASRLKLHLYSTFPLELSYFASDPVFSANPRLYSSIVTARVVGLFQVTSPNRAYWHGDDFNPITQPGRAGTIRYQNTLVIPSEALLPFFDHLRALHHSDAIFALSSSGYSFTWYYQFQTAYLTGADLPSLMEGTSGLQATVNSLYANLQNDQSALYNFPYIGTLGLSGDVFGSGNTQGSLQVLQSRLDVVRIPAGVFTVLTILLILFFGGLATTLMIDDQLQVIALLRGQGASRKQIFGSFFLQIILLSLFALVAGIPLALYTTLLLANHMLASNQLDALNSITSHPWQTMIDLLPYTLILVVMLIITGMTLSSASRMDVLSLRSDSARSTSQPFWQRFNLDVVVGAVALLGFGFSFYVTSVGSFLQADARALLVTPLSVLAPFFLILSCLLLFLRFFPLLLRGGFWLAERGRGIVALLVLAYVARAPRLSLRMIMLLSLATAFTLFTLVYNATELQHIQEVANYQAGADFSAQLITSTTNPQAVQQQYARLPGVLAASAGYVDRGYGGHADLTMDFRAVDASSFGSTVTWSSPQTQKAGQALLAQMIAQRDQALASGQVPAIVDQTTLQALLLKVGSTFTISLNGSSSQTTRCRIIGVLDHIPTINPLADTTTTGGVLVDYQTYLAILKQGAPHSASAGSIAVLPELNQVWLHTKSDAASLASIRKTLQQPALHLTSIVDRASLLATLQSDPLYLILLGALFIETITALLLALAVCILGSWVEARARIATFVPLRALGTTLRQITLIFLYEQAIVYVTGLLLGVGIGALLIETVLPQLTFTSIDMNLTSQQIFALQSALAVQIVMPPSLLLALCVLAAICGVALLVVVRVVVRPAVSQALRVDSD